MKVSVPLTRLLHASTIGARGPLRRSVQHPLTDQPHDFISSDLIPSIVGFDNVIHAIDISIGNPPQIFRAVLDFQDSELAIASVQTSTEPVPHRYNSSLSETYKKNGTPVETSQLRNTHRGFLSQDNFHISEMQIPDMLFQEAPEMRHRLECFGVCDLPFDTVFPLAPYNASYEHNFMSPLARLVESEALDQNIFSLRLSRNPTDDNGWLLLGAHPSPENGYDPDDSFKTIPASDLPIPHFPRAYPGMPEGDAWKFQINSFSFGNYSHIHKEYKNPTVAVVEVYMPFIGLSNDLFEAINEVMGADAWAGLAWMNCSIRDTLPDVTFVVAGEEFVLTAYDYTLEQWDDGRMLCQSVFMPILPDDDESMVLLGSAFLRPFITVWDLEERSMSYVKARQT